MTPVLRLTCLDFLYLFNWTATCARDDFRCINLTVNCKVCRFKVAETSSTRKLYISYFQFLRSLFKVGQNFRSVKTLDRIVRMHAYVVWRSVEAIDNHSGNIPIKRQWFPRQPWLLRHDGGEKLIFLFIRGHCWGWSKRIVQMHYFICIELCTQEFF
jgi:hypothetical protein